MTMKKAITRSGGEASMQQEPVIATHKEFVLTFLFLRLESIIIRRDQGEE